MRQNSPVSLLAVAVIILLCHRGSTITESCSGGKEWQECASVCPLTCDNYDGAPVDCGLPCMEGCVCPEGKVELDGVCVNPSTCGGAVVGLERTSYQTAEGVGVVEVCVIVYSPSQECPIAFPFIINLSTGDHNAAAPTDYVALSTTLMFAACETRRCVNVAIVEDILVESIETFGVTLERTPDLDSRITLNPVTEEIEIIDNDLIEVGLERSFYQVSEDVGAVNVCAVIKFYSSNVNCPVPFFFDIKLSTGDGSAASPSDYESLSTNLTFNSCETKSCVTVTVYEDMVLEESELFGITLERTFDLDNRIVLAPVIGQVEIRNTDRAVVGLEKTAYNVSEDVDEVEVCAVVLNVSSCYVPFQFSINMSTVDGSAEYVNGSDYCSVSLSMTFEPCEIRKCITVSITDDLTVEEVEESFVVRLDIDPMINSMITVEPVPAVVTIRDNDVTQFGLESADCIVGENQREVYVCVELKPPYNNTDCPVAFPFQLHLSMQNDTAVVPDDHGGVSTNITIEKCSTGECITLPLYNDMMLEQVEAFRVSLERVNNLDERIILHNDYVHKEVIIVDDDVTVLTISPILVVEESRGAVEVCVTVISPDISCPISFQFELNIYATDGTAVSGVDYTALDSPSRLRFPPCGKTSCLPINIVDDEALENVKYFIIRLEMPPGLSRFILEQNGMQIIIVDLDGARIGFESSHYSVSEDEGEVRVCAVVQHPEVHCGINFPFNVSLSVTDGSAVSSLDYESVSTTFIFAACQIQSCVNITINDDCVVEESGEVFSVHLRRTLGLDRRIRLSSESAVVNITDNVLSVGLEQTSYTVLETNESVEVCAVIANDCTGAFSVRIRFRTLGGSADAIDDYTPQNRLLRFTANQKKLCINIPIINDLRIEQRESFGIVLERSADTDHRISIHQDMGVVHIENDDEAVVGFERSAVAVQEDEEMVRLCIKIISPDIKCPVVFPFDLIITAHDGTAVSRDDYTAPVNTLRFSGCLVEHCVDMNIVDDSVLEPQESFTVSLMRSEGIGNEIQLEPDVAEIFVIDNDEAIVRFDAAMYTVDEGGLMAFCVGVAGASLDNCLVNVPFNISFTTVGGSAVAGMDYTHHTTTLIFDACELMVCDDVSILDDCVLEEEESFHLILERTSGLDSKIKIDRGDRVVAIIDHDSVVVGLKETSGGGLENIGSIEVCAVILSPGGDCTVDFTFTVHLRTHNNSAVSPEDYISMDTLLLFEPNDAESCVDVIIQNDNIVEQTESFTVTLEKSLDLNDRVILNHTDRTISIIDDDDIVVGLEKTYYMVSEDVGVVEVCVNISSPANSECPITSSFDVLLSTVPVNAKEYFDYIPVEHNMTFESCSMRSCVEIFILEDTNVEIDEVFNITLGRTPELDRKIKLDLLDGQIQIMENDHGVVSLTQTVYNVRENRGRLAVCALVVNGSRCLIDFEFKFNISTEMQTAVLGEDYSHAEVTVTIPHCARVACTFVTIINDVTVEHMEESFVVNLEVISSLTDRIKFKETQAVVTITDDDAAIVALEEASLSVMEGNNHSVFVCANVTTPAISCPVDFDFDITFSANADSNDYDGVPATVKYPACALGMCINITIVDDAVLENTESFLISLTRTTGLDNRIILTGTTEIQIRDNDSAVVAMKESYKYVSESDDAVSLCAVVENEGSATFSFNINLLFGSPLDSADIRDDFQPSRRYLTFEPMTQECCITVAIRNSVDLEMPESFFVTLQRPVGLDERISINTSEDEMEVEIFDDYDTATIGFQNTVYYLRSGQSSVRVCVTEHRPTGTNCPIQFPFDMRFQLVGDTNGIFKVDVSNDIVVDYDASYLNLLFDSCQRNLCFNIDLKDGISRPARGERFPIELSRTPDHGRTTLLDPVDAEIVIS